MNQKAFAIFIGAIMVLSAFAGFVLRGPADDGSQTAVTSDAASASDFGVGGRLVEWDFGSIGDMLQMCPENTVYAYWVNLSTSQNLTDAARAALPQSYGLVYSDQLYANMVERTGLAVMNDSSQVEFQWVKPYKLDYEGLTVPYEQYLLIPRTQNEFSVVGKPILFGAEKPIEDVIDVISGGLSTDKFTLGQGQNSDLQVASLGRSESTQAPIGGDYDEFYMGVKQDNSTYYLDAEYLNPRGSSAQKIGELSAKYGLPTTNSGGVTEVSGSVDSGKIAEVLKAFNAP
jgi:hypothetical protein